MSTVTRSTTDITDGGWLAVVHVGGDPVHQCQPVRRSDDVNVTCPNNTVIDCIIRMRRSLIVCVMKAANVNH